MPIRLNSDEIGDAHRAGDHDRRIGPADLLVGDGKRGRRQPAAPFDRRAIRPVAVAAAVAAASSIERALIGSTVSKSVLAQAYRNARAEAEFPAPA